MNVELLVEAVSRMNLQSPEKGPMCAAQPEHNHFSPKAPEAGK